MRQDRKWGLREGGSSAANVTEFDDLQLLPISDGATDICCFSVCS